MRYGVWGVRNRVLLGFYVGVNRVLLESVECREVCVLGSKGACVEGWCWVVGAGGERGKKTILVLVP